MFFGDCCSLSFDVRYELFLSVLTGTWMTGDLERELESETL